MSEEFLSGRVALHCGDSREVLRSIADCSIDSIVCDPPYALVSIAKRFGKPGSAPVRVADVHASNDLKAAYARASAGFMGQSWDVGETAFAAEFWAECLRVLKPGGHVVAFGGTRTYHRLAVAIEDAGFEVRDMLSWLYGSGFPKSHDVSKGIDRAAGAVREVVARGAPVKRMIPGADQNVSGWEKANGREFVPTVTKSATADAAEWEGWGTALKPACEPICLARKPLIGTVAENVLAHGTGAINVDGCRVGVEERTYAPKGTSANAAMIRVPAHRDGQAGDDVTVNGRWPANVLHDGSDEVVDAFPDAPGQQQDVALDAPSARTGNIYGKMNRYGEKSADSRYADKGSTNFAALPGMRRGDSGSAARFFYTSKADGDDRLGSNHPTVKPVDLMQWLVRLVTPPGGLVLDPFAGTGTTAEAAFREGMRCVLVEREASYQADIRRRMGLVLGGPDERRRASEKEKEKRKPHDPLPLFGGIQE